MDDQVIGKEVDGYRIQEVLGRGGMGTVYKAEDVNLSRPVALKRINPGQSHRDTFIHRFRSEAKALARIDSRHITGVYALRETDIGLLIVMEYVDGGTLKDRIEAAAGPMALDEALPILEQILQAFHDAHSAGVIHRDIKPQNIMLSSEGMVKVTDFGIAKLRRPDSGETVTQGGQGGTLKYMSPEQVSNIDEVDDRSDLYSIGMTAYEMLAGALPFEGQMTDFDIMQTVVEGRIPPPSRFNSNLAPSLATWIQTATAKSQDNRYQSAEAMLAALREAQDEADVTAESPDWDEQEDATVTAFDSDVSTGTSTAPPDDAPGDAQTVVGDTAAGPASPSGDSSGEAETVVGDAPTQPSAPGPSDTESTPAGETAGETAGEDERRESAGASSGPGTLTLVGGLLVLLLVAGGGYWAVSGGSGSGESPTLTLSTDPSDATVSVNGQAAGKTPLTNYALSAGAVAIQLRKEGYREVDTVLQDVEQGRSYVIEGLELPPKPARLSVPGPSGAEVYVDGQPVGTAPLTGYEAEPGMRQVRLEKSGATAEQTVDLSPGQVFTLENVSLSGAVASTGGTSQPEEAAASGQSDTEAAPSDPAPEPATGRLSVSDVTSGATLVVDGEEKGGAGTYTVRAGTREVVCRHTEYSTIRTTVTVREGQTESIGCYYEREVSVNMVGPWGNVVVNGENTKTPAPTTLRLSPGTHELGLSVKRNEALAVSGGRYRTEVSGEVVDSGSFSGTSYTLTVEPGFEKVSHAVVFTVEE